MRGVGLGLPEEVGFRWFGGWFGGGSGIPAEAFRAAEAAFRNKFSKTGEIK